MFDAVADVWLDLDLSVRGDSAWHDLPRELSSEEQAAQAKGSAETRALVRQSLRIQDERSSA